MEDLDRHRPRRRADPFKLRRGAIPPPHSASPKRGPPTQTQAQTAPSSPRQKMQPVPGYKFITGTILLGIGGIIFAFTQQDGILTATDPWARRHGRRHLGRVRQWLAYLRRAGRRHDHRRLRRRGLHLQRRGRRQLARRRGGRLRLRRREPVDLRDFNRLLYFDYRVARIDITEQVQDTYRTAFSGRMDDATFDDDAHPAGGADVERRSGFFTRT